MKKILLVAILVCIETISFAQENPASVWANQPVVINGNASEWVLPLKYYDNQTNLFFAIKNDSNNVYLCFQAKDEMNQAKIINSGMKIILSDKINGKHKSSIAFPLAHKHNAKSATSTDEVKPDPLAPREKKQAAYLDEDTMMELKGFANTNGIVSIHNTSGIRAAINFDSSNTLTYEIAIPFQELFGNHDDLKDVSKDISLNVIINAMTDHSGNGEGYSERGSGRGGRMGGYGGQHRGNENGGEENEQSQLQRAAMAQKAELKQKFVLASQSDKTSSDQK